MMNRFLLAGSAALLAVAAPAFAQMATETTGMATAADIGVAPNGPIPGPDYVKLAAASDQFEIQSARVALSKSQRADVKAYAKMMIDAHTNSTKSLTAALTNNERKIQRPSTKLDTAQASNLKLLKSTPKASFDNIYLTQQIAAHQQAWALQKGYAVNGTDPALKQVAATIVPVVEQHYQQAKALAPASISG
ncbi:DUF4142 domain-containing protein [Sphingomonas solaris]|uniref:DUF4142 domain-containing protein n=1 Tax=Alterirhizorhabdus solaris TaxID=2529389 RepID=A0A558QXR9_9SPHN|nr:DUF4142 domain-containing protein [Sphingomonas solaris]TVV71944.1 DUF4142 domain-containing protein [Sphingomonas solaris]